MVEVEGSRVLVPACSGEAEDGMVVRTDTERTVTRAQAGARAARLVGRPVDGAERRGVDRGVRRRARALRPDAATVHEPVKVDNDLYVRDYAKCILCYKCVDACGEQWQNTFAIAVAGRGFDARISTEHDVPLPDSACVYCGNCIEVCPTGALTFTMRVRHARTTARGTRRARPAPTRSARYCGVGCNLTLHVQDNQIVKVTSPHDHPITHGNLCIKGRFGFTHVQDDG